MEMYNAVRAVITSEEELHFEAFSVPSRPDGSFISVQVERTIISAGTELANYTGLEPDTRIPGRWCTYPWNPGYGGIGRVLAVGPDVSRVKPGDRVYGKFQHANYALLDSATQYCVNVPEPLDSTTAAFVRMGNVAITAFQRATVCIGDVVAVIGLGLVGNLAGQFFRIGGQRVIGIDPADSRRSLAEQVGFHATLDPANYPATEALGLRLAEITGGNAPRVVVDAVGDSRLVEQAVRLVARNGQVILLGSPRAPYETNCTPMLSQAHLKGVSIIGALEWNIPLLRAQSAGLSTESNAELIFRLIESGELQVEPLCSHVIAPSDLNDAYQGLLHRKSEYLGVVIDWENNTLPESDWTRPN